MTAANGGSVQAYNVQLAVSDDHVIIACQAHQSASDRGGFEPMLTAAVHAAQALHGHDRHADRDRDAAGGPVGIGVVLADAGYLSEHNLTVDGPPRLIATGKHRDLHKTPPGQPPPASDDRPIAQMRGAWPTRRSGEQYKRRRSTVEPVNAHLKHSRAATIQPSGPIRGHLDSTWRPPWSTRTTPRTATSPRPQDQEITPPRRP